MDDPHPAPETPELRRVARVEDEPGRADILIAPANARDPSLEPRHPEALVAQPERLCEEQRAPGAGIRDREDQRRKLIPREQFGRGAPERDGANRQFEEVGGNETDREERDREEREEPRHQGDLTALQDVVDDAGDREAEPDAGEHEQRHRLPLDLRPSGEDHDLTHEFGGLRRPPGPEKADQRRNQEEPGPEPKPVEPSHAGERRLAGGDGPAFDLADDDELGHDSDPEQPPDREPVGRHEVGPEEELTASQTHAERDDGGPDDVPEAGHPGHAADELERRAVTAVGKGFRLRRVRQGALVERLVHAVTVLLSLLVARGDRVRRHRAGSLPGQGVGGSKRPSGTVSPAATSSK